MIRRYSSGICLRTGGEKWSGCSCENQMCVTSRKSSTANMLVEIRSHPSLNALPNNHGSAISRTSPTSRTNEAWLTHRKCVMSSHSTSGVRAPGTPVPTVEIEADHDPAEERWQITDEEGESTLGGPEVFGLEQRLRRYSSSSRLLPISISDPERMMVGTSNLGAVRETLGEEDYFRKDCLIVVGRGATTPRPFVRRHATRQAAPTRRHALTPPRCAHSLRFAKLRLFASRRVVAGSYTSWNRLTRSLDSSCSTVARISERSPWTPASLFSMETSFCANARWISPNSALIR